MGHEPQAMNWIGRKLTNKMGTEVMQNIVARFAKDESGATAIEYGLIAAIVGVGIISGLGPLRDGLNTLFGNVKANLTN